MKIPNPEIKRKGIGIKRYNALFSDSKIMGNYHALIAGIVLPNDPCIALHEKFGFKRIAQFDKSVLNLING